MPAQVFVKDKDTVLSIKLNDLQIDRQVMLFFFSLGDNPSLLGPLYSMEDNLRSFKQSMRTRD